MRRPMDQPESEPRDAGEPDAVARARCGDLEAFGELVNEYSGRALAVAIRILGSQEDAEEVVQDAFLRAWRGLPRFRGDAQFATWLHRIVVNCALDKRQWLRKQPLEPVSVDEPATAPHDLEATLGARRWLDSHLGRLPRVQQDVLALYYVHDRSVAEVARALGLNPNTVKTHLHRARAALRRDLEEDV